MDYRQSLNEIGAFLETQRVAGVDAASGYTEFSDAKLKEMIRTARMGQHRLIRGSIAETENIRKIESCTMLLEARSLADIKKDRIDVEGFINKSKDVGKKPHYHLTDLADELEKEHRTAIDAHNVGVRARNAARGARKTKNESEEMEESQYQPHPGKLDKAGDQKYVDKMRALKKAADCDDAGTLADAKAQYLGKPLPSQAKKNESEELDETKGLESIKRTYDPKTGVTTNTADGPVARRILRKQIVARAATKIKDQWAVKESEELDELSKSTLGSYVNKAANSAALSHGATATKRAEADEVDRFTNRHMKDKYSNQEVIKRAVGADHMSMAKSMETTGKRIMGIGSAVKRLVKEALDATQRDNKFDNHMAKGDAIRNKQAQARENAREKKAEDEAEALRKHVRSGRWDKNESEELDEIMGASDHAPDKVLRKNSLIHARRRGDKLLAAAKARIAAEHAAIAAKKARSVKESEEIDEGGPHTFVNVATSTKIIKQAETALAANPNMFHGAAAGNKTLIAVHKKHIAKHAVHVAESEDQAARAILKKRLKGLSAFFARRDKGALVEMHSIPSNHTIEAQGIRGMKATPWRKSFKNHDHLAKWADENDSVEVHGTRDLDRVKNDAHKNESETVTEGIGQLMQKSSATRVAKLLAKLKAKSKPAPNAESGKLEVKG